MPRQVMLRSKMRCNIARFVTFPKTFPSVLFKSSSLGCVIATCFGVLNDQVTITISREYYSVFKHDQFAWIIDSPDLRDSSLRVQAVAIAILSSWWLGAILGLIIGFAAAFSKTQTYIYARIVKAQLTTCLISATTAVVLGCCAYILFPRLEITLDDWPFLTGIHDMRHAFLVGWWHNGAYIGAVVGLIKACRIAHSSPKLQTDERGAI
jgi:hypothetical protein